MGDNVYERERETDSCHLEQGGRESDYNMNSAQGTRKS